MDHVRMDTDILQTHLDTKIVTLETITSFYGITKLSNNKKHISCCVYAFCFTIWCNYTTITIEIRE